MSSDALLWTAAAVVLAPLAFYTARYLVTPKPIPGIPHHPVRPLVGDLPKLIDNHTKGPGDGNVPWFARQHYDFNTPVFQILMGPFQVMVSILDAREIEDILTRRTEEFQPTDIGHSYWYNSIPLAQIALKTGPMWKSHRKLLSPSMTNKYLAQMTPRMGKNVDNLIQLWNAKIAQLGETPPAFGIASDLGMATLDSIADITFGENFGALMTAREAVEQLTLPPLVDERGAAQFPSVTVPLGQAIDNLFWGVTVMMHSPPLPGLRFVLSCLPSSIRSKKLLAELMDTKLAEARRKADEMRAMGEDLDQADCVLDMAMQRESMDGNEHMDDQELKDELLQYIFAGQETTAAALEWGIKFLSHNPDVQRRLKKELIAAFDTSEHRPLTFNDVNGPSTPYLEAVVAEVLRCAHVAGAVIRQATRDVMVLGHLIPRGTMVLLHSHYSARADNEAQRPKAALLDPVRSPSSLAAPRSKSLWKDDGVAFNPDRWLDAEGKFSPKAGTSFPFSAGPRSCFGQRLANHSLKLFIASLNMNFFFERLPDQLATWKAKEAPTRHPQDSYAVPRRWSEVVEVQS